VQHPDGQPRVVGEPGHAPAAEQAQQRDVVGRREVVGQVDDGARDAAASERVEDEDVDAQRLSP
jgi:hypothetical protein